jgi:murein DD-endopeptidase MepM/ murein hydrolase activator NlpD
VLRSRKLWIGLIAAATLGVAAIPNAASAEACSVTVTLGSGQQLTFNVNIPAGSPLSAIQLPVVGDIIKVTESCAGAPTATGTTTSTTTSAPTPSSTKQQAPSSTTTATKWQQTVQRVASLTKANGEPASTNPTLSFALPGAAALGVPNFFIDSFQIPPFLLPIYQAAGIEYDVPWQVLAAINWIETDYGRDLSVSSAGAVGWMQFLPSTFKQWGVDATGSGYADPYNPTDAIFTAARYLQAAGASTNLDKAIFAYNHATWYVQSVLLRAQLIGGMPSSLIGALTSLVEGHFPVAAAATYADDSVTKLANQKMHGVNVAIPVESTAATGTAIFAKAGSPVVAVNDGKIVAIGSSAKLGRYIKLQDDTGNTYTYSHLGSIPAYYPVPKAVTTTAAQLRKDLSFSRKTKGGGRWASTSKLKAPAAAASAGTQAGRGGTTKVHTAKQARSLLSVHLTRAVKSSATSTPAARSNDGVLPKQRLFANPSLPASYAAGGKQQIASEATDIADFQNYFSDILHLARNQYTLATLKKGSIVVAGTILGRIGAGTKTDASHLWFQVQPAGQKSPYIDPKPILDGWKLLEATAVYRAAGINPFFGSGAKQATIGEVLLESKEQLENRVLADPHVSVYNCGRRDVRAGLIDRRILAAIEFLSASGLDPTISGLACDAGHNGIDTAGASGASMDISAINNIPILGHQGSGSITDITIRRLLTLQGFMAPTEIISLMSYRGQSNTLSLPDHANRIQVTYTPSFGKNKKLAGEVRSILKPRQWIQLIQHIGEIPEPTVLLRRSVYAVKTKVTG